MEDENAVQSRIQRAVDKMFEDVEMKKIRSFKQNIFLNISKCFENRSAPTSVVEQCAQKHGQFMQALDQTIQQEMGNYQQRIQRCFMDCSDAATDKYPDHGTNPAAAEKARVHMLQGASTCADKHIAMLKSIQAKLEADIDELSRRAK